MVNELLRAFDMMIGALVAYDNNSRNPTLIAESQRAIEAIRELIKNAEKS